MRAAVVFAFFVTTKTNRVVRCLTSLRPLALLRRAVPCFPLRPTQPPTHPQQGSMQALPLTLIAQSADGSRHLITPPPANILPAHCVEAAQVREGAT